MGVGMSVSVAVPMGVIEPVPLRMLVTMGITGHPLPFYFVLLRPLAPFARPCWMVDNTCL